MLNKQVDNQSISQSPGSGFVSRVLPKGWWDVGFNRRRGCRCVGLCRVHRVDSRLPELGTRRRAALTGSAARYPSKVTSRTLTPRPLKELVAGCREEWSVWLSSQCCTVLYMQYKRIGGREEGSKEGLLADDCRCAA